MNNINKMLLASLVWICVLTHGVNMLHFPYFENDEGVYVAQAWSLVTKGELAPYTYWYDHAPGGWFFIALWNILTGGFFTFGFSLNSGRIFMLLLHVLSVVMLYQIAKKMTNSMGVAFVAGVLFCISPLGIYFQRRILLDNIMIFWVLLSLYLIYYGKQKLRYVFLSAVCFGISILSKENSIFFIPIFLYVIYTTSHPRQRAFAIIKWMAIMGSVVSLYFLYAFIKGELFPSGSFLGGSGDHVSLLGSLKAQASRDGGGIRDMEKSSFWLNFRLWVREDPWIIYGGIIATVLNLILGIKNKAARVAGILSALFWFFLMRGGLVIEFYIVPLLPILALNIAIAAGVIGGIIRIRKVVLTVVCLSFVFAFFYYSNRIRGGFNLYTADQTTPQVEAVEWMLSQERPWANYVIDNYGYVDLQTRGEGKFNTAHWYWKVDLDSEVRDDLLKNDPSNVDFVALTPQMEHDITTVGLPIALEAWHNSRPVARFWKDGWGVEFWATNYPHRILSSSWESYKKAFMQSGRVIDPQTHSTTSEGQSYAMLRAVWMNDKKGFDEAWNWTRQNLANQNNLFSWKWTPTTIEEGSATDADSDIALALLFASKQWNEDSYWKSALPIIKGIWENEVFEHNGSYYLGAGPWANQEDEIIMNPSYFSPYAYKIFAEVDGEHPWNQLVDSTYMALERCTQNNLNRERGALPPEWCSLDKQTNDFIQPREPGVSSTEYSYNAFRVSFRVALDYMWFGEVRAKNYMDRLMILREEYGAKGKLATAYSHDGSVWEDYESVAAYGGNIAYFVLEWPELADDMYLKKIREKFYEDDGRSYWEDPDNYYTQNWGWFGTALYNNNLPNLWNTDQKY
jgi:endo-1,4-beta-D-glucanase Y